MGMASLCLSGLLCQCDLCQHERAARQGRIHARLGSGPGCRVDWPLPGRLAPCTMKEEALSPEIPGGVKRSLEEAGFGFDFQSTVDSSGYSLQGEAKKQSEASEASGSSLGPSASSLGRRPAKSPKHSKEEGSTCRHCPESCAKGQIRCWVHKRAYDAIHKNIMKEKDPEEINLFEAVFGLAKTGTEGDTERANAVLNTFLQSYPDGQTPRGKPRGKDFKLSSVNHATGFRKQRERSKSDSLMDFELFCGQMKSLRQWDTTRCTQEWQLLKCDPNNETDMGGPRWSRERVQIPAWLLGSVTLTSRDVAFEERVLNTATKAKAPL